MADTKLAKVGITVKESWKNDISYEVLDYTLWRVQDGGDGCGYIAKRANIGVVPNSDDSVWIQATQAGQSIYDLAVKYGHFVGTEEEFEAEYQAALQAARDAASETSATNTEIQEAEELRKTAENARVEAETARQTAETERQTAETARETAETARETAETQRGENETTRQSQEAARQNAEQTRQSNEATRQTQETARESAELERTADFEGLKTDMQTAIQQADAATAAANEINRTVQQNETARQQAEIGRATAETQRQTAETQRGTNEQTRQTQETARQTAESTRNTQEGTRQTQETARQTAEQGRAGAESQRVNNETARQTAETARETQATTDHQRAESDHAIAEEDHATLDEKISHKADIDGSYDGMAVGIARNLEGRTDVTDSFFKRTTGGDAEVANGTAQLNEVKGKSQVWNQLMPDNDWSSEGWAALRGDTSIENGVLRVTCNADGQCDIHPYNARTTIANHKYCVIAVIRTSGKRAIISTVYSGTEPGTTSTEFIKLSMISSRASNIGANYPRILMSTAVVGDWFEVKSFVLFDLTLLGIDNLATVEEVEAWLAENIGEQVYYPYNAGEVLNNKMTGVESIGFNLLDPATGKADIIGAYSDVYGNYYGITGTHGVLTFTDKFGNTETITPDEDGKFLLEKAGELSVADAGEDCAVFLWWDGTQTEYKPYEKNDGKLDVTHIYGKLNGEGEYVRVWPTGMPGIGDIKDSLKVVDGQVVAERKVGERAYASGDANSSTMLTDGLALTYYVLSTSLVYSDLIYRDSEAFADGTPVTLPVNYKVDNWGIERVVPQNTEEAVVTTSPELTMRYSIDAVEELNTHRDEIDDLYEKNEELDERKPEKYGEYPDMAVGSANTLAGQDTKVEDFVFKALDCADGLAKLNSVRGKSLVWNQQFDLGAAVVRPNRGATKVLLDGVLTVTPSESYPTITNTNIEMSAVPIPSNHIFYWRMDYKLNSPSSGVLSSVQVGYFQNPTVWFSAIDVVLNEWNTLKGLRNSGSATYSPYFGVYGSDVEYNTVQYKNVVLFDLTLMFGAGNEPATVEEFEAMFPLPYYDYNPGEIISNKTEEVKVTGFNQWDGTYRNTGSYINASGITSTSTNYNITNFIECVGGRTYYINGKSGGNPSVCFYKNKDTNSFISGINYGTIGSDSVFTAPINARYMLLSVPVANKDIFCINLSDPSRNGEYEPYKTNTVELNLPTLTGKLNGEGESVVVFPDGLKSAGSVYDEIVGNKAIKRVGVVDMGTLTYTTAGTSGTTEGGALRMVANLSNVKIGSSNVVANLVCAKYTPNTPSEVYIATLDKIISVQTSNNGVQVLDKAYSDAATFKSAMDGVLLYYELATPEEYILDAPLPDTFQAYKGGTIKQLPENTSEPATAPMVMVVTYSLDAVGILTGLPKNYISLESLQAMLNAMQSAGLFTSYTITWNESQGKYNFTFQANQ